MASEALTLDGLALHESPFVLEEGTQFIAAKKKPQFASNPDTSGEALIDQSQLGNSKFEVRLRVEPQEDLDTALAKLGELRDKLQKCERIIGGSELVWTPGGATRSYIAWVLLGEETDLPQVLEGEDSGFYLSKPAPVAKITLTCDSLLEREEREVLAAVEGTGPQQVLYVSGVEGDAKAKARLVVTDKAEQDRRYLEWGAEQVESEEGNPDLLLEADTDFTVEGYAGELAEGVEGSHSTKVIKATLSTSPVALATATELPHKTPHYGKLRVKAGVVPELDSEGALFRLAYRTTDGEWRRLTYVEPPVTDEWCELSMRELGFEEVEQGSQVSEIRIEAKCEEGTVGVYVDTLGLTPTDGGRGEGRGITEIGTPRVFSALDAFDDEVGGLTATEADLGGTWEGFGDEADFEEVAESEEQEPVLQRSVKLDVDVHTGRYVILTGTSGMSTTTVGAELLTPSSGSGKVAQGVIARASEEAPGGEGELKDYIRGEVLWNFSSGAAKASLRIVRESTSVPGSDVVLLERDMGSEGIEAWNTIKLLVTGTGLIKLYWNGTKVGNVYEPLAATGEALAEGKVGVYDAYTGEETVTREYRNFAASEPTSNIICHASQSAEVRHTGPERENEGGTAWAPMPFYRGANFYLPPQGDDELLTRLMVKMRRNDSRTEPDAGLEDAQTVGVLVRESFLRPR